MTAVVCTPASSVIKYSVIFAAFVPYSKASGFTPNGTLPPALAAAAAAWSATPLELTQRGDYGNEKVKHG